MLCESCGRRIARGRRCLILALGIRRRLCVQPQKEEVICCSRACGMRVLRGEVFSGPLGEVSGGRGDEAGPSQRK